MKPTERTKVNPCPHCGKPDWCYNIGDLSVCKRGNPPADGYMQTSKSDKDGSPYYAPIPPTKNPVNRKNQTFIYTYTDFSYNPVVQVHIVYDDMGKKKVFQKSKNSKGNWVNGLQNGLTRDKITVYRYQEIRKAIANGSEIFIVEGERKADMLWDLGLPATCNIGGSGKWQQSDTECLKNAKIILVPDRDEPGIKHCFKIEDYFPEAKWLYVYQSSWFWGTGLPKSQGVDIADWISEKKPTQSDILELIEKGWIPEKPITQSESPKVKPESSTVHGGYKNLSALELLDFLYNELKGRLKFDDLMSEVILDDQPVQFGTDIKFWFLDTFGEVASKDDIYDCMVYVAKRNTFNPVKDYLGKVAKTVEPIDIENLATKYFGRSEPIYNRMIKMWLTSAVARIFEPGCKVDHCLILQSSQGKYKSTWFKILAGNWFTDSIKDIENKDSLLALHSSWIIELSELDQITSKKQAGSIKHFLTQRDDMFRRPYAKDVERYPRRSVFCGTVNPSRFLVDDENRRFWIIPVADSVAVIDIDLIQRERDAIWAAAMSAYSKGERWHPDESELSLIKLLNDDFREVDPWEQPITDAINNLVMVSTFDILTNVIQIPVPMIQRRDEMRVSKILNQIGWVKETRKEDSNGKIRRYRLNPYL